MIGLVFRRWGHYAMHLKQAICVSNTTSNVWIIIIFLTLWLCQGTIRPPCRIRSDRQTTSLTLTTGVWETGTKMRGASNMNIHYDVTGLLTAAWRSHSGQIVWAAWINCQLAREEEGGGGFWTHSTYTGYPGFAGGRQLDRWRCIRHKELQRTDSISRSSKLPLK